MESLTNLLNILKVALGLGFVVFLHELGHFLLAKWNGVKVEKFSIGFGPTLLGFTKGDTEYVLAAIPLGGFVKMLGEGPEEEANKTTDPNAYPNKSVGARMAIISAGVIMNLILGLACFVYAYGQGRDEFPAWIGGVVAGSPAYQAGLRAGDQIIAIDGRRDLTFNNLMLKVRLSGEGQVLRFEVKRSGVDSPLTFDIEPKREAGSDHPNIGVFRFNSLRFLEPPLVAPAGLTSPYSDAAAIKMDEVVQAAGPVGEEPKPIRDILEWNQVISKYRDRPLNVVVSTAKDAGTSASPSSRTVELPANRFVDFGFRLSPAPIAAIQGGSPAEKAGLRKGDRILKVDGDATFDPLQLPTLIQERAGSPVTLEVERLEPGAKPRLVTFQVTPDDSPPWVELSTSSQPLEVPGLGLAYHLEPKIVAIRPGSPAEKAGLKVGDTLTGATLPAYQIGTEKTEPIPLDFGPEKETWTFVFQQIQLAPRVPIELTVNNDATPISITPEPVDDWYHPQRGEQFQFLLQRMPPLDAQAALRKGLDDTVDNILSIYAMFRSLFQRRVSPKSLGGPIMIARVAYRAAGSSLTDLIHFLGILSINLAVLNFLPIPPLDGGQMVFLIGEKIRGRPLPDSAVVGGTYLGLLFVLGLMVFVIFQDVSNLVTGKF